MLSTKILELEDIIRNGTSSDITNKTINELQESIVEYKANIDYLKNELKEANNQILKLSNTIDVYDLQNKQLRSEVETITKLSSQKKVRFNLEEESHLEDIKSELKREKALNVQLEAKLFLQVEDFQSIKGENMNLMDQIELLSQEIDKEKKDVDYYKNKIQEFKLIQHKKRKEKSKKYKEKILFLSNEVMRLHAELYTLRTTQNDKNSEHEKEKQSQLEL